MNDKPCEKCGHCPACGRSNQTFRPYPTYPSGPIWITPSYPSYRGPYYYGTTITCNGTTGTTS